MKTLLNQYLRDYNTIRIGGKVRWMFFPHSSSELLEAINFARFNKAPFFILAGGSNTVFDDKGMNSRQVVINLSEMDNFEYRMSSVESAPAQGLAPKVTGVFLKSSNNNGDTEAASTSSKKQQFLEIECEPGMVLQSVVDLALDGNAGGMVGLNRVPGTIGGAVVGNAGAYGCEAMSFVDKVEYIDLHEVIKQSNWINVHILDNKACKFGYRDSIFKHNKNWLITNIHLRVPIDADLSPAIAKYNEIAIKRDAIYPKGFASPGSLFKNILFSTLPAEVQKNIPAEWVMYGNKLPVGKLLENLGCQGFGIGNIQMRPTHANIMTNLGNATYANAIDTVKILQKQVKEKFGIDIEPEVRFIEGDFSKFWK
jgi:UDP-N-acetylmuramate dehydrogenase